MPVLRGKVSSWKMPALVLLLSSTIAGALMASKVELEPVVIEKVLPSVRVIEASPVSTTLKIQAQGVLAPAHQIELISELDGRVTYVSESLAAGRSFNKGDLLVEVDRAENDSKKLQAEARFEKSQLEYESSLSNLKRVRALYKRSLVSSTELENAERKHRLANADLKIAELELADSLRNLDKASVYAPFSGVVREEHVEEGAFVRRGDRLSTVYESNLYQVRLPISNRDIQHLDQPSPQNPSHVSLKTQYAGMEYQFNGELVRLEAEMDTRSSMLMAVVEVSANQNEHNIPMGLFVTAEIHGRTINNVYRLHRRSVREGRRVLIVDDNNRLRTPEVEVLRREGDYLLVTKGVNPGDRICSSPIDFVAEGMEVSVIVQEEKSSTESNSASGA